MCHTKVPDQVLLHLFIASSLLLIIILQLKNQSWWSQDWLGSFGWLNSTFYWNFSSQKLNISGSPLIASPYSTLSGCLLGYTFSSAIHNLIDNISFVDVESGKLRMLWPYLLHHKSSKTCAEFKPDWPVNLSIGLPGYISVMERAGQLMDFLILFG